MPYVDNGIEVSGSHFFAERVQIDYAAHVVAGLRSLAEQPYDAVLEHFAADKADIGVMLGLRSDVLAGAEADLEPDGGDRHRKQ